MSFTVETDIAKLRLPFIDKFEEIRFVFNDGNPMVLQLGQKHDLEGLLPHIPVKGETLKVFSEVVGSELSATHYFFYELLEGEEQYVFYRSLREDGEEAKKCGTAKAVVSNPRDTVLTARGEVDGGNPIIIIGTINIDPTVIEQVRSGGSRGRHDGSK